MNKVSERYHALDYARGCLFLILAVDHASHAYAQTWGRLHFMQDIDRSVVIDVLYMFSNSMVMPGLFFLCGLFAIPSLERHGLLGFFKRRTIRLGLPFILGIPILGPLLVYPSHVLLEDLPYSLLSYVSAYYFEHDLSVSGPFWVLYALFLYTGITAILYRWVPFFGKFLSHCGAMIIKRPVLSAFIFIIVSALILTVSDYYWSAFYWVKLWWIFSLQGGRFLLLALYFLAGVMLGSQFETFYNQLLKKNSPYWNRFVAIMLMTGTAYIGYALNFLEEGAYGSEIRRFLNGGQGLFEALPLIKEYGGAIAVRTTLHAVFCFFQIGSLLLVFTHFSQKNAWFWAEWSTYAYLIFLVHEVPVLWLQYALLGVDVPIFVKILVNFVLGVLGTWVMLKLFVKDTWIKRVKSAS